MTTSTPALYNYSNPIRVVTNGTYLTYPLPQEKFVATFAEDSNFPRVPLSEILNLPRALASHCFHRSRKWPNMANITPVNNSYCFRIWSSLLDTYRRPRDGGLARWTGHFVPRSESEASDNLLPETGFAPSRKWLVAIYTVDQADTESEIRSKWIHKDPVGLINCAKRWGYVFYR